jgi:peptidyl-prolyl cis-trans isomerase D
MEVIAAELDATVQNASSIDFTAYSIPGVGLEPAVIGTVTNLDVDKVSNAISGNNGVYIVKVTSVDEGAVEDVSAEQSSLAQSLGFRASSQAFEAHQNAVEIVDKRSKFY